jgi:exopolysaccharide production protein ExoZ
VPANSDEFRPMKQYGSIQCLRALAATAVVIHHACERADAGIGMGAAGVDVFFVISGFIMFTLAMDPTISMGAFVWNRLARIVPLYWTYTVVLALAATVFPFLLPHLRPSLHDVVRSLAFIPYRDANGDIFPVAVVGWTLNYEVFFYALFAVCVLLPARLRLSGLISVIASLVVVGLSIRSDNPILATYTNPLLLEFGAGVLLGRLFKSDFTCKASTGAALIGLSIVQLVVVQILLVPVDAWRIVLWGLPAICIVTGALIIERHRPRFGLPLLVRLGDASYSTYLLHPQLVTAIMRAVQDFLPLGLCVSVVLSNAVGILSFRLFERPCNQFLRPLPTRLRQLARGFSRPRARVGM